MPLYDYHCPRCDDIFEAAVPMSDYAKHHKCPCGGRARRIVSAPRIVRDYEPYECPVTGRIIDGRAAHVENLKRTGCRVREGGETEAFKANQRREEERMLKGIEDSIERTIAEMPSSKLEKLAIEVERGADLAVERR